MSINHRIFILVTAAVIVVAWPLLYIAEEMYQEHITRIVDSTSIETVQQTLLLVKEAPEAKQFLNDTPSAGKSTLIFDSEGVIMEGARSAEATGLIRALMNVQLPKQSGTVVATEVVTGGEETQGWDCTVGYAKEINGYIAVCYNRDYTYEVSTSMQSTAGVLSLAVLALALLGAKLISARMTRPLNQLTNYARHLPYRDLSETEEAHVLSEFKEIKDRDIGELVRAFAHMEKELGQHIRKEKQAAIEREKIQSELRIAAEIQQGALPQDLHVPGEAASIRARMLPAQEVGGDLYDYFMSDENTLFFSLGDVSGKGVPAALFMFAVQHTLRSLAAEGMPLNEVMAKLNNTLAVNNSSAMYVTMIVGRYDLQTRELEYAFAGHQPPLLKRADGTLTTLEGPSNIPVGNIDGMNFECRTIRMEPGDRLIACTDGVTEAYDSREELYGQDRLVSLLQSNNESSCSHQLDMIFSSVLDFSDGCAMHDDITALCLHAAPVSHNR